MTTLTLCDRKRQTAALPEPGLVVKAPKPSWMALSSGLSPRHFTQPIGVLRRRGADPIPTGWAVVPALNGRTKRPMEGTAMLADSEDRTVNDWCVAHLGCPVAERTFTAGNLSAVYGLRLTDGREVVLKIRDEDARLVACTWVQREMWQAGFPCPEPVTGPLPLGRKVASAETPVPGGGEPEHTDAPRLFAGLLADFVTRAEDFDAQPLLRPAPAWVHWYHKEDGVWPVPDDRDVNLNAERCFATAWLDELGTAVRERLKEVHHDTCVIGHGDWDSRNVKFRDGRPLAVHDWDSVVYEPEVVIIGQAAAMFEGGPTGVGASVERTVAFLEEYQTARGRKLSDNELQLCWAAGLWVRAFNAKKFHLDNFDGLGRGEAETRMRHAGI
ncbi:hypothetical protein [Streptomyces cacaoi]|uniref:hypothetical protein n=1 Tax=Streptomyces cacaoi TaxID=1898 RepID=UPI003749C97C